MKALLFFYSMVYRVPFSNWILAFVVILIKFVAIFLFASLDYEMKKVY